MSKKNILLSVIIFAVVLILGLLLCHQIAKNLYIIYIIAGIQMGEWLWKFSLYLCKKVGIEI